MVLEADHAARIAGRARKTGPVKGMAMVPLILPLYPYNLWGYVR
jgi:hypothetical protein